MNQDITKTPCSSIEDVLANALSELTNCSSIAFNVNFDLVIVKDGTPNALAYISFYEH